MRLELKDIKEGILEQEYSCSPDEFPELVTLAEEGGPQYHQPIMFRLRFQRIGQLVEVDGTLDATVRLKCGRCLEEFEQTVSETFSLTFTPQPDAMECDDEMELADEDLGLINYKDEILELHGPLQEQLILAIPISPLCGNKCQGLCPECGVNLNEQKCHCVRKVFNNKFTQLAGLDFTKK